MGRVELLFGEMANARNIEIRRHEPPDYTRPLRMQASGRSRGRRRVARWRMELWKRALSSGAGWGRASIIGLLAVAVQTLWEMELWKIGVGAAASAGIALLSGAWTQVALISQQWNARRN